MSTGSRIRPRIRIEPGNAEATAPVWLRLVLIAIGVAIGVLFLASQADPEAQPLTTMWNSSFGSDVGITQLITLGTPLIIAGCAVALALRVGLWNIGVDGQMLFGAWLGTALAFSIPDAPGLLITVGVVIAGLVGGALWAAGPILMRVYFRVNEIVTTLLLNFVAASWVLYWVADPWANRGSQGAGSIASKPISEAASLPEITVGSVQVGLEFPIAILVAVALGFVLKQTRFGFRASLTGEDERTAKYAGFPVHRLRIMVFLASGAVGGLAGVVVELGDVGTLSTDLSNNTGYFGIVVAVLAGRAMTGTIPVGILMGALVAMGVGLQLAGLSSSASLVLTGLLLLLAACADALARYRVRFSLRAPVEPHAAPAIAPPKGT